MAWPCKQWNQRISKESQSVLAESIKQRVILQPIGSQHTIMIQNESVSTVKIIKAKESTQNHNPDWQDQQGDVKQLWPRLVGNWGPD